MKRLVSALMLSASVAFAGSGTSTVITNSVCVSAIADARGLPVWEAATEVSAGQLYNINGKAALAIVAGTTTNASPTITDKDVTDGGVTWREALPRRSALVIANDGAIKVYVSMASVAAGVGIPIAPGTSITLTGEQAQLPKIYAISTNSVAITVNEW